MLTFTMICVSQSARNYEREVLSGDVNHMRMKGHSPAGLRLPEAVTTGQIPKPRRSSTRASGE
jgi:hypothetical protein